MNFSVVSVNGLLLFTNWGRMPRCRSIIFYPGINIPLCYEFQGGEEGLVLEFRDQFKGYDDIV